MKLRVHHLFCSALFNGKGYSDTFVSNMQNIVDMLFPAKEAGKSPNMPYAGQSALSAEKLELCAGPDLICGACPNLADGACKLDDNNVVSKDIRLAAALGLECGKPYRKEDLIKAVASALTEDLFESACHTCRWYQEGLCSYYLLRKKYDAAALGATCQGRIHHFSWSDLFPMV